jgi:photosystem II stability/assembly factor-like uncharacterized protein
MKPLFVFLLSASVGLGFQTTSGSGELPFVMTWLQGKCIGCKIGGNLESLQFTTRSEAWGVAHRWPPPGSEGIGEFIAVHSKDSGRTWTEIPYTQVHAAPPMVRFVDPEDGWLGWLEVVSGESRMQRTRDGGKSWQDIRLEVDALPDFFDESHWYAVNDGKFLVTDDAGKTWRETPIPHLEFVTQGSFSRVM